MNKEIIGAKANLSFYIEQDPFFNGTYNVESDFDKYCYEHCKDIRTVLNHIEKLEKALEEKIKYCNELEKDLFENCSNYVVPKQVILDKIEELENNKMECEDVLLGMLINILFDKDDIKDFII